MKKITPQFWIFILFLLALSHANAQEFKRSLNLSQGFYTLGINGGIAYQQSDVCIDKPGIGLGLTLAKNLYYRPGSLFSFDARGRFLYTQSYGLDDSRSYGLDFNSALNGNRELDYDFVYQNHRTDIAELGIEGVLTLNQLRERTGFVASIFGGVDLAWYYTRLDQQNATASYVDGYNSIDANLSGSAVRNQLRTSILDGIYETRAHSFEDGGKLGFMPALGIELGYHFTPRFMVGLAHKVTFSRTDVLDGQAWDNENLETAENDLYHYTNIHFRWILEPHRKTILPPEITILYPKNNPHTTSKRDATVRANIKHVEQAFDVECAINGYNSSFDYKNGNFSVDFPLDPGRNEVVITASNEAGTASETVIIIGKDFEVPPPPPPVVNDPPAPPPVVNSQTNRTSVEIISPASNQTTTKSSYQITAQTRMVKRKQELSLFVNNASVSNFDFNGRNGKLTATVRLNPGANEIKVKAANRAGKDEDSVVITKTTNTTPQEPALRKPTVDITQPGRSPHETTRNQVNVKAKVRHVSSKSDISITIDRRPVQNFNFNASRQEISFTAPVSEGRNQVDIKVQNRAGSASDKLIIMKESPQPQGNPPTVKITSFSDPTTDPLNPGKCRSTAVARITNVSSKNDIQFYLNGSKNTQFSFNGSGVFQASFDLKPGRNDIRIKAVNNFGSDQDEDSVSCQSATTSNQKPTVRITKPATSTSSATKNTALIEATVKNVTKKQDITFTVNNSRVTDFSFNTSSGKVSKTVNLKGGNNSIKIKATNRHGSDQDDASIRYLSPIGSSGSTPKPIVSISKPGNNSSSNSGKSDLVATVKNVSGKNQISVKVNGNSVSDFTYSSFTKKLSAKVNLKNGNNTILVKATNSSGSDQASVTVKHNPVQKPTVKIKAPGNNSVQKTAETTLKATVTNVASKNDIQVLANNKPVDNFTFSNGNVSTKITLKSGKNTLIVKANNSAGNAQDKISVTYEKPVSLPKPTVRITQPTKSGSTVKAKAYIFKATVKQVSNKSGIKVIFNGGNVKNFTFDTKNGSLSIPVDLKSGKNDLKLVATNASGKAETSTTISYKKTVGTPKPQVSITSLGEPTIDPLNPGDARSSLFATVKNVSGKNQIKVKVNGNPVNFTYDAGSKRVSATINIVRGANKVVVTAFNKAGRSKDSRTVNF